MAEIEGLRDVAIATNFGTTLAANGLWREIMTRGYGIKDGLFSVTPMSVGRSLWIFSCGDRNCSRRATVRLGIDTLIASILVGNEVCFVYYYFLFLFVLESPWLRHVSWRRATGIIGPIFTARCHYSGCDCNASASQLLLACWPIHCNGKYRQLTITLNCNFSHFCRKICQFRTRNNHDSKWCQILSM